MIMSQIDFEIIPGEKSVYEIWKVVDGRKIGILGMINDLERAVEIVNNLYRIYSDNV
jgi:hypothetical protein